jgi:carotenoid cleavage dioxygenase
MTDCIAHFDMQTGRRNEYLVPEGDAISEPVFVAAAASAGEGDGFVLAVAYRAAEDVSDLLVLDARNVAAGPVAAARVPRRVPFGFHGNWAAG